MHNILFNSLTIFWSSNNHQDKWLVFCFHYNLFYAKGKHFISRLHFLTLWVALSFFPQGQQAKYKIIKALKIIKVQSKEFEKELSVRENTDFIFNGLFFFFFSLSSPWLLLLGLLVLFFIKCFPSKL